MRQRDSGGPAVPPAPRLVVVLSLLVMVLVPPCQAGSRGGHQILWGRCYSHCIQRHLLLSDSSSPEAKEVEPDALPRNPIRACHRHRNCRWCLYVCERPEKNFTNSTACLRDCRFTRTRPRSGGRQACTEACGFVGRASSARGGKCPAPLSLNGFQSACITSCHRDGDCSRAEEKCCSNNCGAVCTKPYDVHILPPVPSNISFKMLKTGGVMVKWSLGNSSEGVEDSGSNKKAGGVLWAGSPVVYILRWWCPYTSGAVNSVTDRARTKLQGYPSGIYPGSKCHFMVAAVNGHGSQGFSRVSPYIKKFLTPSPPLHLDKVRSRLHKDGLVDVTVQWQPPVYTDGLPVFKYQVFWSDHLPEASPSYMRFHMYRRVLDADKTTFVLQSLRPGTLYFVQVRAVVRWKGRQKRGELASAYIETYSPPHPHTPQREDEGGGGKEEREEDGGGSMIESVTVNQTFFHNTILKAAVTWTLKPNKRARKYLIYWRAETCARSDHRKLHHRLETSATSHDRSFILYNLQPECEYAVRVHPVSKRDLTGAATVTNFVTPPCHVIHVQQGEPPTCHTADPPSQVQGLHSETSGCITVIRWEPPSSQRDDIEGYDVMWGETEAGVFSTATIIYTSSPREASVPANVTKLEVGRLRSGQHYSIQVRARSAGGSSPPSLLHLRAPFPSQPCAASSSSTASSHGSESPADETGRHSNSTLTSSQESKSDANDTSDVSGYATTGSPALPSETHPGDVSSNRTGDVSITLDITDRPGDRVDGGGVSVDSLEEGGAGKGRGATPTPDPASSSTKDFTDAAFSGGELIGDGSQNRTEPVRGVLPGGHNKGVTQSTDTTTYGDLNTTVFYPGEGGSNPLSDIPRNTSTASANPGVRGAGKTLQASPWILLVCCLFLCLGVLR